jgi:hypothetical protein
MPGRRRFHDAAGNGRAAARQETSGFHHPMEFPMSLLASPHLLRSLLWADAASSLASGALHLVAAASLATLLGIPESLLTASGIALLGYVALAVWLATNGPVHPRMTAVLVAANFAWAAVALALLFDGALTPTVAGRAYLLVQALAVATLAELQWMALRRQARRPS